MAPHPPSQLLRLGATRPHVRSVAPGYEYKDATYHLNVGAGELQRAQQIVLGHVACAAQLGWHPDEPTDMASLLAAGRVCTDPPGQRSVLHTVTLCLRPPRRR